MQLTEKDNLKKKKKKDFPTYLSLSSTIKE